MTNTIEELMDGKLPGQITIVHTGGLIFTPYFIETYNEKWVGKNLKGYVMHYAQENEHWKIYEEPKKLVKKWLWAVKTNNTWYNGNDSYFRCSDNGNGSFGFVS